MSNSDIYTLNRVHRGRRNLTLRRPKGTNPSRK